ncbi:MAG: glycoside hydrolase family 3 protein [Oceanipulchritudo sp.]
MNNPDTNWIESTLRDMTLEQKVGHLLMPWVREMDADKWAGEVERHQFGSLFISPGEPEATRKFLEAMQAKVSIPLLIAADIESGYRIAFPPQMGCAAGSGPAEMRRRGRLLARTARAVGVHWTFSPVIDLALNHNNPETQTRAYGEDPETVARMAAAYIEGVQADGRMAATAKHFPGAGLDDRDQHLCTTMMPLDFAEWEQNYGRVWKAAIASGVMTVMSGHIAFPAYEGRADAPLDALPATLSLKLQNDLLREHLCFQGVIVSDAAPMIGISSRVPSREKALANILAGGDIFLFAEAETDAPAIFEAVHSGKLSMERLDASVRRILTLKAQLGIQQDAFGPQPSEVEIHDGTTFAQEVADRSITVFRNDGAFPVVPQPGANVLSVRIFWKDSKKDGSFFATVTEELRKRGLEVDELDNPTHTQLIEAASRYDRIFLNIHHQMHSIMGTPRLIGHMVMSFWRGFWVDYPGKIVCTSFGSPYVFYELPHLPNMIAAWGVSPASQRAAVKVWLGEIEVTGRCPVRIPYINESPKASARH